MVAAPWRVAGLCGIFLCTGCMNVTTSLLMMQKCGLWSIVGINQEAELVIFPCLLVVWVSPLHSHWCRNAFDLIHGFWRSRKLCYFPSYYLYDKCPASGQTHHNITLFTRQETLSLSAYLPVFVNMTAEIIVVYGSPQNDSFFVIFIVSTQGQDKKASMPICNILFISRTLFWQLQIFTHYWVPVCL